MNKASTHAIRLIIALIGTVTVGSARAQLSGRFQMGYFEGGEHPMHARLRGEFIRQLQFVLPEEYEAVFVPEGYRSAGWKRDTCRIMARQLVDQRTLDLIVAVGPWVVEDLLAAGCTTPILAMYQFDPVAQGLVNDDGRPITPNLTVQIKPDRVRRDLETLNRLLDVTKLGVLYFPSGDESDSVLSQVAAVAAQFGMEIVAGSGYDNYGTYAFFKAYASLGEKVDALYLLPMWGMSEVKISEFFAMTARDRVPTFTSEPVYLVESGAFACGTALATVSDARYHALKAARILLGARPDSLAVVFQGGVALAVNEATLKQCGLSLPVETFNEAYLVKAPVAETTARYSLPEAIARALSSNPGFLARYDAVEAAEAAARQAYAPYLPHLVGRATVGHLDDNTIANSRGLLDADPFQSALLLRQQIFSAETIKAIQLASKQKDAARISLQQSRLDLELAVGTAAINYLAARETLGIHERYRTLIDRLLEFAGSKEVLHEGSEVDRIRWNDERHQATASLVSARGDLRAATVLLNALFNLPGDEPLVLDTTDLSVRRFWQEYEFVRTVMATEADEDAVHDYLVQQALELNPVIRGLAVDIAVQKDLLAQNTARYLPTLDFEAGLEYVDRLNDEPPLFEEEHATWSVWGGVTWPLFLGTERIHQRSVFKAELSALEFEQDAARLQVMGQVRSGMHDLSAYLSAGARLSRSAELAGQGLRLIIEEYESDQRGLVDMLDALNHARATELRAVTARYGYFLAMARVVHAVGWSARMGNSFRDEFYLHLSEQFSN